MARVLSAAQNSNNISYIVYTSLFIHFDIFISVWHFWQAMFPGNSIAALCIPYTCYRNENSIKEFSNQCKSKAEILLPIKLLWKNILIIYNCIVLTLTFRFELLPLEESPGLGGSWHSCVWRLVGKSQTCWPTQKYLRVKSKEIF